MDCLSVRAGSNPVVTADNMARSSNGSGCETLILAIRVRLPYGLLKWPSGGIWYTRDTQNVVSIGHASSTLALATRQHVGIADAAGAQLAFIRPVSPARYRDLQLAGRPVLSRAS